MIDRKKVIKALEACHQPDPPECWKCPYADNEMGTCYRLEPLLKDALGLLIKMQDYIDTLSSAIKVAQNVIEEYEGVEM